MNSSVVEEQIADLWNRAVELGNKGRFDAMLKAWLEVQRFDEQHQVLDDRERARMHLFVGNAYLANRKCQKASEQYAKAACVYLQMPSLSCAPGLKDT